MRMTLRLAARLVAVLCLGTGFSAVLAAPNHTGMHCLWSRQIGDTQIPDNQTIIFVMRDGTRWRTHLAGYCPALKTYGFYYRVPEQRICDRMIIHVNRTHTPCSLGLLEKLPPEKPLPKRTH